MVLCRSLPRDGAGGRRWSQARGPRVVPAIQCRSRWSDWEGRVRGVGLVFFYGIGLDFFFLKNKNKKTNQNNQRTNTQIKQSFLQEADGADIHAKLLLGATNVHRCNIYNGQARGLLRPVLDDCLAPFASVFLGRERGAGMPSGAPGPSEPPGSLRGPTTTPPPAPSPPPYRAAVLQDAVGEPAVALGSDLHVVGALDEEGFLQVARLLVHVGDAVLAVVGDVLGALGGQQAEEGQLDAGGVGRQALIAVAELWGRGKRG